MTLSLFGTISPCAVSSSGPRVVIVMSRSIFPSPSMVAGKEKGALGARRRGAALLRLGSAARGTQEEEATAARKLGCLGFGLGAAARERLRHREERVREGWERAVGGEAAAARRRGGGGEVGGILGSRIWRGGDWDCL